ncbi:MAG: tetratricopeptide repeat protein [Gloeobacteraceae cyanobacterium ES-bin-316]|nr:tetratricopeptide repeat protein [Ferruginibacter sp.]
MKNICFLFLLLMLNSAAYTQKYKADSIRILLAGEQIDSNRVKYMWLLADVSSIYNPDSALILSQEALTLAQRIKYLEGESRSLGIIANVFSKIGNYPKALEFYLRKLKIEEKRNNPRNLASVNINMGIVYVYQEEYKNALGYYYRADSIIRANNLQDIKYHIALNLGDVYDRLNRSDSAFSYFRRSLALAIPLKEKDLIGASMVGLGHTYFKMGNTNIARQYYEDALLNLQAAADEDLMCEAALGLAKLYKKVNNPDSATYFANFSLSLAKKDGFQSRQLDAVNFLAMHYKDINNTDSAFMYLESAQNLKDSIGSKERVRQSQILSSNESIRQLEIAATKKRVAKERSQQLQLLFIGIFIPGLFLITLFLSRIKINVRVIKSAGIISLLILFEYLTILLHPRVVEIANHIPIVELFIFVCIAALLLPAHHRIEHWLIAWLTRRQQVKDSPIQLKISKLKMKKPST